MNIIIIIIITIIPQSSYQKIIIISITDETAGVQGQKRLHALLFLWNRIGREPTAYAKVLGAPSEKVELGTARTTNCYLHLKGLHLHLLSATGKQHVLLFCPTHLTDCSHSYKGNMTLCPCLPPPFHQTVFASVALFLWQGASKTDVIMLLQHPPRIFFLQISIMLQQGTF